MARPPEKLPTPLPPAIPTGPDPAPTQAPPLPSRPTPIPDSPGLTLTAWEGLSHESMADLFNRVYEGYEVPLHIDAGMMLFMETTFDLEPERSVVAWREGRAVGVALLGVRGPAGWVGGMGVEADCRRHGLGEALMRALIANARAAGVRRLALEVLEQNHRARALYEKLGFQAVRRLSVFAIEGACPEPAHAAGACAPREARVRIAAERDSPEPWQRGDGTVDHLDVSTPALRAVRTPEGAGVFRITDGRANVLQMVAASEAAAGLLLDTIRSRAGVRSLRFLNVPDDDFAAHALRARGATCQANQYEMALALEHPVTYEQMAPALEWRERVATPTSEGQG